MSYLAGICRFDFAGILEDDRAWAAVHPAKAVHETPSLAMFQTAGNGCGFVSHPMVREAHPRPEGLVCCLDGRLDNCSGQTSVANRSARSALEAYQLRGLEGLRELIGEWSLAIWDAECRKIILACDFAGTRPLYYSHQGRTLRWSSALDHLAQWTGAGGELDAEYAAEFLTFGSSVHRTPYPEIRAVAPGMALEFSASGVRQTPLWCPPIGRTLTYKDTREYAEHLYELFEEAVSLRLETPAPVFAEFSGGLDSSAVSAMASKLVREGKTPCPKVVRLSYRQANSSDEAFIDSQPGGSSRDGLHLDLGPESSARPAEVGLGSPRMWQPRFAAVAGHLGASRSEVLLTGQLGDLTMANFVDDSEQAGDRIARGQLGGAIREAMLWSRSLRRPVLGILAEGLREAATGRIRPMAGAAALNAVSNQELSEQSLTPLLIRNCERRLAGQHTLAYPELRPALWRDVEPSRRKRFLALENVIESRSLQCPEPLQDFLVSHPFAHRPLVEYMLRIPPAVTCRPGEPRRLMRQSFAGLLPPAILKRRSKATFTEVINAGLRPMIRAIVDGDVRKMRLAEMGFVDPGKVGERLERLKHGLACDENQLRRIVLLEHWIRGREMRRAAAGARVAAAGLVGAPR